MAEKEKELTFTCWNCQKETIVIVTITRPIAMQSKPVPVLHYCEHCNKPNKVLVPDNIDVLESFLGKEKSFPGYRPEGNLHVQGEEDR